MKLSIKYDDLFLTWASLPAIFFAFSPGIKSYFSIIAVTYIVNIFICCKKPKYIIPSYFIFLIVSPLWFNFLGLSFIVINLAPLGYLFLYFITHNSIQISRNVAIIIAALIIICVVSFAFSPNSSFLFVGVINFMIIPLMIVVAYHYTKSEADFKLIESTFIYAGVAIVIIIWTGFIYRVNLGDFLQFSAGGKSFDNSDIVAQLFPKGTFFYNNIFYILGITLLISYSNILTKKGKLLYILQFIFIFSGLVVLFNKTAFIALLLAIIYCTYVCRRHLSIYVSLAIMVLFGAIVFSVLSFVAADEKVMKMVHLESLWARVSIFDNIVLAYSINPKMLFLGYGPESLTRVPVGENPIIELMKTSQYRVQGTLDSALLSYAIEYGIFFIVIYMSVFFIGIFKGLKPFRENASLKCFDNVYNYGGACFVYVLFTNLTQVLSTGKVSWIVSFFLSSVLFVLVKHKRP